VINHWHRTFDAEDRLWKQGIRESPPSWRILTLELSRIDHSLRSLFEYSLYNTQPPLVEVWDKERDIRHPLNFLRLELNKLEDTYRPEYFIEVYFRPVTY
jgi:hypothetical protein